jgi:hypothetical protein
LPDLRLSFEQAYLAGADVNVMWGEEVEWEPADWPPHGEAAMKAWFKSTFAPLVNGWTPPARAPQTTRGSLKSDDDDDDRVMHTRPVHSWATLPVAWHSALSDAVMSAEAVKNLSKFPLITLEKSAGSAALKWPHGLPLTCQDGTDLSACGCCEEDLMVAQAKQIKALNPKAHIVAYMNSIIAYPWYRAARKFASNSSWWLRNSSGELLNNIAENPTETWRAWDFSKPEVGELWIEMCLNVTRTVRKTASFFECFPYVCPEHVLAKRPFLYVNGSKMPFFAGCHRWLLHGRLCQLQPSWQSADRPRPAHERNRLWCEKRHFLRHLYIKCVILPRQARDKHRENSKGVACFAGYRMNKPRWMAKLQKLVPGILICGSGGGWVDDEETGKAAVAATQVQVQAAPFITPVLLLSSSGCTVASRHDSFCRVLGDCFCHVRTGALIRRTGQASGYRCYRRPSRRVSSSRRTHRAAAATRTIQRSRASWPRSLSALAMAATISAVAGVQALFLGSQSTTYR